MPVRCKISKSILYLSFQIAPHHKGIESFIAQLLAHGDRALRSGQHDLLVDGDVVEAGSGGVFAAGGEDDAFDVGPAGGGEAHGAGFAVDVEGAAGEMKFIELCASSADGDDFGVCGGIVVGHDAVVAAAD